MHPILETLQKMAHQAQETWEDEAFQRKRQEAMARLAEMVRKNPVGSVGIALLAGFFIGKITKRSGKG
ncbi:MAG: hypothetical protein R6U28_08725 [Cyclonatronaceae bacterium]